MKTLTSSKRIHPGPDMGYIPQRPKVATRKAEPSRRERGVYRGDFRTRTLRSLIGV